MAEYYTGCSHRSLRHIDRERKKLTHDPELFLVPEVNGVIAGSIVGGFDRRRGLIYHLAVARPSVRIAGHRCTLDEGS
jgi:hypothetical protein